MCLRARLRTGSSAPSSTWSPTGDRVGLGPALIPALLGRARELGQNGREVHDRTARGAHTLPAPAPGSGGTGAPRPHSVPSGSRFRRNLRAAHTALAWSPNGVRRAAICLGLGAGPSRACAARWDDYSAPPRRPRRSGRPTITTPTPLSPAAADRVCRARGARARRLPPRRCPRQVRRRRDERASPRRPRSRTDDGSPSSSAAGPAGGRDPARENPPSRRRGVTAASPARGRRVLPVWQASSAGAPARRTCRRRALAEE